MIIKKICPLMTIHGMGRADCGEEKCAWWDKEAKICAIVALVDLLDIVRREGWGIDA